MRAIISAHPPISLASLDAAPPEATTAPILMIPPSSLVSLPEGWLDWPQWCARRGSTAHYMMLPPSLLAWSPQGAAWSILNCARRTRPFRGRAFREQEDDQA